VKHFPFWRNSDEELIIVEVMLDNKQELKLAIDTGATHTTIDYNALQLSGYELKDKIATVFNETANGIVESEIFEIKKIAAFGVVRNNFRIQVYDFLVHGISSDYHGLLGLDFFEGRKFCVDLNANVITL